SSGFGLSVKLITPDGNVHHLAESSHPPDTLALPASPPGVARFLLTLHIGDAKVGNRHDRSFSLDLTVLAHNPYIAAPPVRGADLVGRDADLARLHDKLRHGSIQLTGERRIGKTSLLHHLADHPGAFAPIWLDAQDLPEPAALRT